jgi:hypothetical protein
VVDSRQCDRGCDYQCNPAEAMQIKKESVAWKNCLQRAEASRAKDRTWKKILEADRFLGPCHMLWGESLCGRHEACITTKLGSGS